MVKGTVLYDVIVVWRKGKRVRTPSRWTKDPEKDIPANKISAEYLRWAEGHTRVPLLGSTVSSNHTAHQSYNQLDNVVLTKRIATAILYRKPTR